MERPPQTSTNPFFSSAEKRRVDNAIEGAQQGACRVILVRHGLAEGDGRFQGQLDVGLTYAGRRQLPALVQKLSRFPIVAAYTSDLARARATAAAVANHFCIPLQCRSALREMNFGDWQGLSWNEIEARFPRLARIWLTRFPRQRVPNGESFPSFRNRVIRELRAIVGANPERCVVVVTHAGVIRVLLASALGIPEREIFRSPQHHCAINVIDHFQSAAVVRCMNA